MAGRDDCEICPNINVRFCSVSANRALITKERPHRKRRNACPSPRTGPRTGASQRLHPPVLGPVAFRVWKRQLERIHELLRPSGSEETFQRLSLARRDDQQRRQASAEKRPFHTLNPGRQAAFQRLSSQALRCNLARTLLGLSLREFACRLAESILLQWFCKLDRIDTVRIPGKSAPERYRQWLPEPQMRSVIDTLLEAASAAGENGEQPLGLAAPLDLEAYCFDTTCVKLHIHFPVDWVLLWDAAGTLLKAVLLIRKRDVKARMEEAAVFLKRMNRLSMKMTQARRNKDARRLRKAVLRELKKFSKIIAAHAQRRRELLAPHWRETDLKEGTARLAIFKNGLWGSPILNKGHVDQKREVCWSVLAHNLWVMARRERGPARALRKAS